MKRKNLFKKVLAMAAVAAMVCGLTACGGGEKEGGNKDEAKAKTMNGYYTSTQNVDFISAYPEYTFKQATFSVQTIETYDDGSYCLTVTSSSYSGSLEFSDDGSHSEIPRGVSSTKYYGTYKTAEESGLITLTLASPTAVAVASNYSVGDAIIGYLDTNAWTDEMGTLAGGEDGAISAADYLKSVSYPELAVIIDSASDSFDYTVLNTAE